MVHVVLVVRLNKMEVGYTFCASLIRRFRVETIVYASSRFKWLYIYYFLSLAPLTGKGPKLRMSTGPRLGCYATERRSTHFETQSYIYPEQLVK